MASGTLEGIQALDEWLRRAASQDRLRHDPGRAPSPRRTPRNNQVDPNSEARVRSARGGQEQREGWAGTTARNARQRARGHSNRGPCTPT
eukprot:190832-Pyramimonas_sp.AAC.1